MSVQKLLFSVLWDLADTSPRYGVYGDVLSGEKAIKTSGSSTTVSENTTGDAVFQGFANGDLIHTKAGADGAVTTRVITDATNAPTSVVVNSAVTLASPTFWRFQKWNNGTAATDGWFSVAEFDVKSVQFEWVTKNATSADVTIQGKVGNGAAATIWTENFTAVASKVYSIPEYITELRVGVNINTDGGANNFRVNFVGETFARL